MLNDNIIIVEPKDWGSYKCKYFDTVINLNNIKIEMRSNNLTDERRDSIFNKLRPTSNLSMQSVLLK